jgi:excisionase family DNA binding protein
MTEQLLTAEQLANFLQVSVETIRRYTRSGELECTRLGSRHIRFSKEQVDTFLEARSATTQPETETETETSEIYGEYL